MIRRGFWLAVGAAGGIMGYRRASSLGRQVSQTLGLRPAAQPRQEAQPRRGAQPRQEAQPRQPASQRNRHWARGTLRFTRDVRDGMDLYFDRQPGRPAPTLGGGPGHPGSRAHHDKHDKHDKRHDKREEH